MTDTSFIGKSLMFLVYQHRPDADREGSNRATVVDGVTPNRA